MIAVSTEDGGRFDQTELAAVGTEESAFVVQAWRAGDKRTERNPGTMSHTG